jgi:hypothetical protein
LSCWVGFWVSGIVCLFLSLGVFFLFLLSFQL